MYRLVTFSDFAALSDEQAVALSRDGLIRLTSDVSIPLDRFPRTAEDFREIDSDLQAITRVSRFKAVETKLALDEIIEFLHRDADDPTSHYRLVEEGWLSATELDSYDLLGIAKWCNALARYRRRTAGEPTETWQGRVAARSGHRQDYARRLLEIMIDADHVPANCLRNGKIILARIAARIAPMVDMTPDSCAGAIRADVMKYNKGRAPAST